MFGVKNLKNSKRWLIIRFIQFWAESGVTRGSGGGVLCPVHFYTLFDFLLQYHLQGALT